MRESDLVELRRFYRSDHAAAESLTHVHRP